MARKVKDLTAKRCPFVSLRRDPSNHADYAGGGGGGPLLRQLTTPELDTPETQPDSNQTTVSTGPTTNEACKTEINSRNGSKDVVLYTHADEPPMPPKSPPIEEAPPTEAEIEAALNVLSKAFRFVADDPVATEALRRKVELLGRPSGSSPPQPCSCLSDHFQHQSLTPTTTKQFNRQAFTPKELWLGRNKALDESPKVFIERVYKDVLGTGISRQDIKKYYDSSLIAALDQWQQKRVSDDPKAPKNKLPDNFGLLTKSDEVDCLVQKYKEGDIEGMSARDYRRAQASARYPSRKAG